VLEISKDEELRRVSEIALKALRRALKSDKA
jgi:hypothetical protein